MSSSVRPASLEDVPTVATAYGNANLHDPVFCWVIPDADARRRMIVSQQEYTSQWLRGIVRTGEVIIAEDESGATTGISLWEFIDGAGSASELESPEAAAFLEQAYGEYAPRMALLMELTGQRHPRGESHWYLQNVVVDPGQRGKGLGSAMLRHRLSQADEAGLPAYLEASSPRNRTLYERHGFRSTGEPIELPDGPHLQPMWRPAAR